MLGTFAGAECGAGGRFRWLKVTWLSKDAEDPGIAQISYGPDLDDVVDGLVEGQRVSVRVDIRARRVRVRRRPFVVMSALDVEVVA